MSDGTDRQQKILDAAAAYYEADKEYWDALAEFGKENDLFEDAHSQRDYSFHLAARRRLDKATRAKQNASYVLMHVAGSKS